VQRASNRDCNGRGLQCILPVQAGYSAETPRVMDLCE